jgi:plastocyanin
MRVQLQFLAGTVMALAACSEYGSEPDPVDPGPPTAAADVNVVDDQFVNNSVRVLEGGAVTWTWQGNNLHNVTFQGGPASDTQTDGTFEREFPTAGVFRYMCTVHGAAMSGTVTVVAPAAGGLARE